VDANGHKIFSLLISGASIFQIRCFKFSVPSRRANFFPIGTQQPKPVVRPVANEIAMLRNQETIAVLAGRNNFEFDSGTNEMLFTVRAIDNVKHTRSCPRLAQEVNESSVGGKLWPRKTSKDRFHLVAVLWMNQHRWIFSVGSDLP